MHVAMTKPRFAWDCLEDNPSLATIKAFLGSVPDARLLEMLRQSRGRDDYPVHVLWGVLLLRIALRHVTFEATLAELTRNEPLCRLIGIAAESRVPKAWNVSRFLDVQGQANLPEGRLETLAYDKAADDRESHRTLHEAKIRPVIQNRHLWKDQTEQMLPGHDGTSNIVYDEAGTLYCYDRTSEPLVRHKMAYIGYEPQRETIKYRCPARHEGWACPHDAVCNAGKSYGKTVRVDRTIDLRRFPPIPRATKKFERLYDGRTSVERVNARLKIFWGVDDGNITGARRFHAMVGAVLIVHVAFATLLAAAPRREGTLGKLRLGPIQKALAQRPVA
jgi:hypothetical protein